MIAALAGYAENTYINASYINQAIISDFIQRGLIEDHIEFLKNLYEPKWRKILESLDELHERSGHLDQTQRRFLYRRFPEWRENQARNANTQEKWTAVDGRLWIFYRRR